MVLSRNLTRHNSQDILISKVTQRITWEKRDLRSHIYNFKNNSLCAHYSRIFRLVPRNISLDIPTDQCNLMVSNCLCRHTQARSANSVARILLTTVAMKAQHRITFLLISLISGHFQLHKMASLMQLVMEERNKNNLSSLQEKKSITWSSFKQEHNIPPTHQLFGKAVCLWRRSEITSVARQVLSFRRNSIPVCGFKSYLCKKCK